MRLPRAAPMAIWQTSKTQIISMHMVNLISGVDGAALT